MSCSNCNSYTHARIAARSKIKRVSKRGEREEGEEAERGREKARESESSSAAFKCDLCQLMLTLIKMASKRKRKRSFCGEKNVLEQKAAAWQKLS